MDSRLHPGNPSWAASTQAKSRNPRVSSRARASETASIELDVDAFAFVPEPRTFRPWRRRRRRDPIVIKTAVCPDCGETTSSATNHFCAGCHFAEWWGRWAQRASIGG
jgi:hypothetical protein